MVFFFQAFAINDYTATNNFVHAYFVSLPLHIWNTVLEVGLLGQRAMACVILLDTTKLPPRRRYTALHSCQQYMSAPGINMTLPILCLIVGRIELQER